jgi:hypothetical protein
MPIIFRFLLKPLLARLMVPTCAAAGAFLLTLFFEGKSSGRAYKPRQSADASEQQSEVVSIQSGLDLADAQELVEKLSSHVAVPPAEVVA